MFKSCSAAAQVSFPGAMYCKTGGAVDSEWSIWELEPGVRQGGARRPSGIVEPKRAERGGGEE